MPILVDVKGYEMIGDDVVLGDSLVDYPPMDYFKPSNIYPVGVYSGGYDLCIVVWLDRDIKQRKATIRVKPKGQRE